MFLNVIRSYSFNTNIPISHSYLLMKVYICSCPSHVYMNKHLRLFRIDIVSLISLKQNVFVIKSRLSYAVWQTLGPKCQTSFSSTEARFYEVNLLLRNEIIVWILALFVSIYCFHTKFIHCANSIFRHFSKRSIT